MRVWDQERGTIRQFADALASESGALPADDIYQRLLGAIWDGEFERNDRCAVSLPNANASGIRRGPNRTWLPIDEHGNEVGMEFPEFTREDLRDALTGRSSIVCDATLSFDVLKGKPLSSYEIDFRSVYLDRLMIETSAVKELMSRLRASGFSKTEVLAGKNGYRDIGRPTGSGSYATQDRELATEALNWLSDQPRARVSLQPHATSLRERWARELPKARRSASREQ